MSNLATVKKKINIKIQDGGRPWKKKRPNIKSVSKTGPYCFLFPQLTENK